MKIRVVRERENVLRESARRGPVSKATWIGLFLSLFGMLLIRQVFVIFGSSTVTSVSCKETLIWLAAASLLVVIRRGERLPLTSVGIGTVPWRKSILWSFGIAVACLAGGIAAEAAVGLFAGPSLNPTEAALGKLPLALVFMICLRAGIVEELFFRGYAWERLQAIGCGRFLASALSVAIFGFGHWTGGYASVFVALTLGAILTAFYFWRRDLVANMIGHWLVDFVSVVLPRLGHG